MKYFYSCTFVNKLENLLETGKETLLFAYDSIVFVINNMQKELNI